MRRIILSLLAVSLATPVLADPKDHWNGDRRGPPGHFRHIPPGHDKDRDWDRDRGRHEGRDRGHDRDREHARDRDRDRDHHRHRHDDRRFHPGDYARDSYRLPPGQLDRLPRLPRGQEYRRVGDNLLRVDSDTLKIIAVLGLVSAFMAMR
ncbi:hypothetical protein [Falsirhodobacter sp. 1013]|uniref:hypothetical protein n=1 Tax=Falsirhodobacter sp. 1013 TaxID=3417566 RepID=UPI003EB8928B